MTMGTEDQRLTAQGELSMNRQNRSFKGSGTQRDISSARETTQMTDNIRGGIRCSRIRMTKKSIRVYLAE
jgi:hypothetical protein